MLPPAGRHFLKPRMLWHFHEPTRARRRARSEGSQERQSTSAGSNKCLLLATAVGAILVAAVVGRLAEHAFSKLIRDGPRALGLELEGIVALLDTNVTHLAPVLAPAVADDPVLLRALGAPADDADDVVNH